jgi:hypothetical protein
MLLDVSSKEHMQREGGCAVIRQGHLIAVVGTFLIGCAVVLVVGCAGVSSEGPQEEQQGHTDPTKKEQARSPEATASEEEARCQGTRTIKKWGEHFTTNDVPGCPNGGLLSGTDGPDNLKGMKGEDEIHGLGGNDYFFGGGGNDVIYGGPGNDTPVDGGKGDDVIYGGDGNDHWMDGSGGEDVLYGGDGNDWMDASWDREPDKLYCGEGWDRYFADENDYVDSSCEKKAKEKGPPIP